MNVVAPFLLNAPLVLIPSVVHAVARYAINVRNGHRVIIIAGDLNQLNTEFLITDYGLIKTVDQPTHGGNLLNKLFVNLPDVHLFSCCL